MKELYTFREHQKTALPLVRQSFREGKNRPIFQAACGYGKSVVIAHIASGSLDKGNRVLIIVPYTALINQLLSEFEKQGLPQAGVIQASHELTDPSKQLQIATIQTLSRRGFPETDLIIFDEAHVMYESFIEYMLNNSTPVIGFTATPWTKGMGKYYNNLIQPISMRELIERGFLSKYIAYAPCAPDMSGVKMVAGDYHEGQAADKMSDAKITGSITDTWLEKGEDEPTICFATNVAHANHIGSAFDKLNVSNVVITANTDMDDRTPIFDDFADGKIKILINVGTLIAGFDSDVRCIIYARPTKSLMRWVQCVGRGLRTAEGKEKAILLDHSGTIEDLGFPEDIEINELNDGKNTKAIVEKVEKEQKEKKPKKCKSCDHMKEAGENKCSECGFEPRHTEDVEVKDGELKLLKGSIKPKKVDKQQFWSELMGYKEQMKANGKNYSDGYYSHKYKEKFGVWPRGLTDDPIEPSATLLGSIKAQQIAFFNKNKAKNV